MVAFFDRQLRLLKAVQVGALPDMLTFSPNGRWLLVANEGGPNDDYTVDPEGSLSVIDMRRGASGLRQSDVRTADFAASTRPTASNSMQASASLVRAPRWHKTSSRNISLFRMTRGRRG